MTDETLFAAALELSPAERAAYLDANCPDPAVRNQVEALLAAADASNPLDRRPVDVEQTISRTQSPPEPSASVGDRIGPYKLLEKIGEGGMGEVWVADQLEPIKRRVALKLIKPGMDSRSVLGRFEAERQALAVMDHPNIAKVLDAGTTADGRPYFVMELVKGTPITEFADARKLTPKQRLELFVPVCQAIQHAHMKGIIHRDIKPGNVLVALHDETPVPKVIDFGVAKAVGQQLTEKTIYTGFGALVGTPTYMAPEQATFNQLDVDTRADVYALGVLLYELLAGSPPIEKDRLKRAALDEVLRIVRDEEPPRPSARLSTSQAKATIAATRGSEPAKLSALMKGELDWIVMKALEKDRTRRYETANGFAADVQRYLNGEQVQAVPPSLGYRLRKAYRRNKSAVWVAVSFVGLVTLAGLTAGYLAVTAEQARRGETVERQKAEEREAEANEQRRRAEREQKRAEEEKRAAEAVRGFLQDDLLRQADTLAQANALPLAGGEFDIKQDPTIGELLDRAAAQLTPERIEAKFPGLPFVQAEVLHALASAYAGIAKYPQALELIDRAIPLYVATRGPDDRATLAAQIQRAKILLSSRRPKEAEDAYTVAIGVTRRVYGATDRTAFDADIWRGVAILQQMRGTDDAVAHFRALKEAARRDYGPTDLLTLLSSGFLASAYRLAERFPEALREIEPVREAMREMKVRPDHPYIDAGFGELAEVYRAMKRPDDAVSVWQELIDAWVRRGDPFNRNTWFPRHEIGWIRALAGDYDGGKAMFADSLKAAESPMKKSVSLDAMRWIEQKQGRLDSALDFGRQALDVFTAGRPATDRSAHAGKLRVRIGQILLRQKKYAEAEPFLTTGCQELIDHFGQQLSDDDRLLTEAGKAITELYTALGKPNEAAKWNAPKLPLLEAEVRRHRAKSSAESEASLTAATRLAHAYVTAGSRELAVKVGDETLARLKANGCPTDDRAVLIIGEMARAMTLAGRRDLAVALTGVVHQELAAREGVPAESLARASFNLGYNLAIDTRAGKGVPHLRESLRLYREIDPNGWWATKAKIWLGTALLWDEQYDEAEKTLREAHAEAVERINKAPNWEKHYPGATAGRLATLYEAVKKPDEAAKWKALGEKK